MSYPIFKNKHLQEALFNPGDYIKFKRINKKNIPQKIILTYQKHALEYFRTKYKGRYKILKLYSYDIYKIKNFGFVRLPGIGSPFAVTAFEEFVALGVKEFINLGTAGGLSHQGIFLCDKAIRDEGTSYHYFPHGMYSYPDKDLTDRFEKSLIGFGLAPERAATWTIDAPYRETKKEIQRYKNEGVATVEMEASALFAVAKYRKVKIAAAFVVSDVLGKKWKPMFHYINIKKIQNKMIDAAVECFAGGKK